jgi:hypothetical protein
MDVEATTAVRQAEVGAAKTMIDRTADQSEVTQSRLAADAGYGSAEMLGWLVDERGDARLPIHEGGWADRGVRLGGLTIRLDCSQIGEAMRPPSRSCPRPCALACSALNYEPDRLAAGFRE